MFKNLLAVSAAISSFALATPAWAQQTNDATQSGGASQAADPARVDPSSPDNSPQRSPADVYAHIFLGAGIGVTTNLGAHRVDDVKVVTLSPADRFVQVNHPDDTEIGIYGETHILFRNLTIHDKHPFASIFACGPFALVDLDKHERGCGPFAVGALATSGQITQVGLGWYIGFGDEPQDNQDHRQAGWGIGVGFVVDPNARRIDTRVVDPHTMMVRPSFVSAVDSGGASVTVQDSTVSALLLISRDF